MSRVVAFLLLALAFPLGILAEEKNHRSVVINEIAWMGSNKSYRDEWIELYNPLPSPVKIDGWVLKTAGRGLNLSLKGLVPARSFFLIARQNTDFSRHPDFPLKGFLSNKGGKLMLLTAEGSLADQVDCSQGWFAGDNKTKQTMERVSFSSPGWLRESWAHSASAGGTPREQNSACLSSKKKSTFLNNNASNNKTMRKEAFYISEIFPSPKGADSEKEWIEIGNKNPFPSSLSGWQIKDRVGKTHLYVFKEGLKIEAGGFFVLKRSLSGITLQNKGDSLFLLAPDGEIVSSVSYQNAPLNKSYSLTKNGWKWTSPSPGKPNIEQIKEKEQAPKTVKAANVPLIKKTEKIPKKEKSAETKAVIFLSAFIMAASSAVFALILKKRFKGK